MVLGSAILSIFAVPQTSLFVSRVEPLKVESLVVESGKFSNSSFEVALPELGSGSDAIDAQRVLDVLGGTVQV